LKQLNYIYGKEKSSINKKKLILIVQFNTI